MAQFLDGLRSVCSRMGAVVVSMVFLLGCADGCGCQEEADMESATAPEAPADEESEAQAQEPSASAQPTVNPEEAPREAPALGGPLAGPEDRVESEGEGEEQHGDTEEEMPTGDPALDSERETVEGQDEIPAGAYNPWDILPVEPNEGADLESGLEILCELTRRVLALEGGSGDPNRLHTLLREGLQPHPSFAEVDGLMMSLQETDPARLYGAVQAAAASRGVSGYQCDALAEVFRRMQPLGAPGDPGPTGDFDDEPEGATVVDVVPPRLDE